MPETVQEPLCVRCANEGATCCQHTRIFLTSGDMERIAAAGHRDFFEWVDFPWKGTQESAELDPAWRRTFQPDGQRRVLRRKEEERCVFLGGDGCALDLSTRPLLCRLYPFDYDANGIKGVYGHRCPYPESVNAPLLLAMLGMNRDEGEKWRAAFYREIEEEFPAQPD